MTACASSPYFLPHSLKVFSEQIQEVNLTLNAKGRVLLLLRGLPGSGKTTLGNAIISMLGKGKMFSADDYFYYNGQYLYRPNEIGMAHNACQTSVLNAIQSMESLIIVANTHLERWQMAPYASMAAKNGYYLMVMEPNTPWRKDCAQLARLNVHGVTKRKMQDFRDRFQPVKPADLICQDALVTGRSNTPPLKEEASHGSTSSAGPSSPRSTPALPQRDPRKRTKHNSSSSSSTHLTRKDAAALFDSVRLSADLGKWARPKSGKGQQQSSDSSPDIGERGPVTRREAGTEISELDLVFLTEAWDAELAADLGYRTVAPRNPWRQVAQEDAPGCHKASQAGGHKASQDGRHKARYVARGRGRPSAEAGTAISELDRVFFAEEQWESLALDLGYRLLQGSGSWEEVHGEEAFGPHKACQTRETPSRPSEGGLAQLCAIFPHAQPSDLEDLLRVTNGDVEWATDVFLLSGYADGVPCERPGRAEPSGDSSSSSSSSGPLSPAFSSPGQSDGWLEADGGAQEAEKVQGGPEEEEEDVVRLSLSRMFLRNAHRKFAAEFHASALDIESLPVELLENWELPATLSRAIYAAYLEHLGQIESADARSAVEAVRPAAAGQEFDGGVAAHIGCFGMPDAGSGPSVRDIIEEEEVIARIYAERRKELAIDAASVLKLNRLTKEFPNLERTELMDLFISFQHREDWTRAHLLTLGHVSVEAAEESMEPGADTGAEAVTENKQELMRERAKLMTRRAHLQEQLRKVAGQRNLMAAAGFYVGELYAVDKSLAGLSERLRAVRVSEQAAALLDLHHFSVPEAIASLKERLDAGRAAGQRQLLVLTGVGRHSRGKAKLRPAVRQFLQQARFRFEEIYSGTFRVTV